MKMNSGTIIIILLGIAIIAIPANYTYNVNPCGKILDYSQDEAKQYLKQNPQYKTTLEGYLDCQAADPVYVMIGALGGILLILIGLFTPYLRSVKTTKCFECGDVFELENTIDFHGKTLCILCIRAKGHE